MNDPRDDTRLNDIRRQTRARIAFVIFIVIFVYAQSYQGRVFLREEVLQGCHRAQMAYHSLDMSRLYVDCETAYPKASPWPWR